MNKESKASFDTTADSLLHIDEQKRLQNLAAALCVILLTIVFEYVFRHYVMFLFPVIGDMRVNDMISLFLAYTILPGSIMLLLRLDLKQTCKDILLGLRYLATTWNGTIWILVMIICFESLGFLDAIVLAKYHLPIFLSSFRNPTVWLAGQASILYVISLLLVNGILVPIAEEFLWRGLVQGYLTRLLHPVLAIGITAIAFSFKHVLVDASFGRFTAIIAFGAVCGALAYKKGWKTSAALHILINTLFSIAGLILCK